jgi:HEAT repeat protein
MYRYKLKTATHIETKLAAARALGRLGLSDGLEIAVKNLSFNAPRRDGGDANVADPPEAQIIRARTLAALAVGAIGERSALPALVATMDDRYDPRVELAAATATLQILEKPPAAGPPPGRRRH